MRGERGQTAAEYLGALLLISVIIGAVVTGDIGGTISRQLRGQICRIAQDDCRQAGTGSSASPRASTAAAKPPKETFHGVPPMPAPPPLGDGDGGAGGDYGTKKARLRDRAKKELAKRLADAAEAVGLPDAARNLRHYLDNKGTVQDVEPRRLLRDIAYFEHAAGATRLRMIQALQRKLQRNYDGRTTYAYEYGTPWESVPSSPEIEGIGGVTVEDGVLGDLHRRGLAREYEVRGTTGVESTTFGLNQTLTAPPPSKPAGGRDGGRSDPARDRDGRGGR